FPMRMGYLARLFLLIFPVCLHRFACGRKYDVCYLQVVRLLWHCHSLRQWRVCPRIGTIWALLFMSCCSIFTREWRAYIRRHSFIMWGGSDHLKITKMNCCTGFWLK